MLKRKHQKPLKIETDFNEALERFALTDPKEVQQEIAKDAHDQRVRLVQRGEGGPPLLMYMTEQGVAFVQGGQQHPLMLPSDHFINRHSSMAGHMANILQRSPIHLLHRAIQAADSAFLANIGGLTSRQLAILEGVAAPAVHQGNRACA
jgi:hypothetical protein